MKDSAKALGRLVLLALSLCGPIGFPLAQAGSTTAEVGDWVQILVPAAGYAGAAFAGDKQGVFQLSKALVGTGVTVQVLKLGGERLRPDAGDDASFPSGHAAAAFTGAEFIRMRYGNGWGLPAYLASAFVGYSRVVEDRHFADDVVAGAAIGVLWNRFFTTSPDQDFVVQPVRSEDGYAVNIEYVNGRGRRDPRDFSVRPAWTFLAEFGPVQQSRNLFSAPPDTGTEIDLATAENEFDVTARMSLIHHFGERHEWEAYLAPMELIEFDPAETIPHPVSFAGELFEPYEGANYETRYNFSELRAVYRYRLWENDRLSVRLGGGLQLADTFLRIREYDGAVDDDNLVKDAEAGETLANLTASARIELRLTQRWSLRYEFDGFPGNKASYLNQALLFDWRPAPMWHLAFGGRFIDWDLDSSELRNEFKTSDFVLSVSHSLPKF